MSETESESQARAAEIELKEESHNIGSALCVAKNGSQWRNAKVLDVGCGIGGFIQYARNNLHVAECWGCDHNPKAIEEAFKAGRLHEDDLSKCLQMSFSEIPKKRPELKGTFDIVKITGVTPYANPYEMRHMLGVAHWLLKNDGTLLLELPWSTIGMGNAFQAARVRTH